MTGSTFVQELSPGYWEGHRTLDGSRFSSMSGFQCQKVRLWLEVFARTVIPGLAWPSHLIPNGGGQLVVSSHSSSHVRQDSSVQATKTMLSIVQNSSITGLGFQLLKKTDNRHMAPVRAYDTAPTLLMTTALLYSAIR